MRDVAARQPRRTQWQDLELPFVARLVADDLDDNERQHNQLWEQLEKTNRYLLGILISTTTASILLAANFAVGAL